MGIKRNDEEELLTIAEVATLLRCSRKRVYNMRSDKLDRWGFGSVPFFEVGGMVLYARRDVMAFVRSKRKGH